MIVILCFLAILVLSHALHCKKKFAEAKEAKLSVKYWYHLTDKDAIVASRWSLLRIWISYPNLKQDFNEIPEINSPALLDYGLDNSSFRLYQSLRDTPPAYYDDDRFYEGDFGTLLQFNLIELKGEKFAFKPSYAWNHRPPKEISPVIPEIITGEKESRFGCSKSS